jgi:hypothetical protein
MSNQKQIKLALFKIVNDSIDTEAYTDQEFSTVADKCKYVLKCFDNEYYDRSEPNYTKRLAGWLQGLPTIVTVPFYYVEIIKIGYKLDLIKKGKYKTTTENNEQKFIEQWFELMAHKLIQMSQMKSYAENQFNSYIAE